MPHRSFPFAALAIMLQKIARATQLGLNFPLDFIVSALIHAAGSAIGNSIHLSWKWKEAPALYMALIGDPGTSKTPPIEWAYRPLRKIDDALYHQYAKEYAVYEIAMTMKPRDPHLREPQLIKTIVSDTTIPALDVGLKNNRRGAAIVVDELSGMVGSIGANSPQYLSLWSRQDYTIDRKTKKIIRIKEPFLSIIGCLQTNIVSQVMGKGNKLENGYLDRLLLVYPKNLKPQKFSEKAIDNNFTEQWEKIINELHDIPLLIDENGDIQPQVLTFTTKAEKLALDYVNSLNNPVNDTPLDDKLVIRISKKMITNFLRLCIIIQSLRWACGEGESDYFIDDETVTNTIEISEYYKYTAFDVWEDLSKVNPLDKLSEQQVEIYKELPAVDFTTGQGLEVAELFKMSERSFKNWIKDAKLFKRLAHGRYSKIYKKD